MKAWSSPLAESNYETKKSAKFRLRWQAVTVMSKLNKVLKWSHINIAFAQTIHQYLQYLLCVHNLQFTYLLSAHIAFAYFNKKKKTIKDIFWKKQTCAK